MHVVEDAEHHVYAILIERLFRMPGLKMSECMLLRMPGIMCTLTSRTSSIRLSGMPLSYSNEFPARLAEFVVGNESGFNVLKPAQFYDADF